MIYHKFKKAFISNEQPLSELKLTLSFENNVEQPISLLSSYISHYLFPEEGWKDFRENIGMIIEHRYNPLNQPALRQSLLTPINITIGLFDEKVLISTTVNIPKSIKHMFSYNTEVTHQKEGFQQEGAVNIGPSSHEAFEKYVICLFIDYSKATQLRSMVTV
jgi:hypothetical protein